MARGKFSGKVALVTGSTSGIGLEIAEELAAEGAAVVLNGLDRAKMGRALRRLPKRCWGHVASVSDSGQVSRMFRGIIKRHGRLDILVNNAGIGKVVPTSEMSDGEWEEMLSVHLNGTFYCTREALKLMAPRKSGKIINIASICGLTGCAAASHYSAAKGGIIGFTKAVAREAIASGINVNAVAPGYIDTPMLGALDRESLKQVVSQIPAGRLGDVKEIASLACWLASEGGNFMVGQVVSPNGGQVM